MVEIRNGKLLLQLYKALSVNFNIVNFIKSAVNVLLIIRLKKP